MSSMSCRPVSCDPFGHRSFTVRDRSGLLGVRDPFVHRSGPFGTNVPKSVWNYMLSICCRHISGVPSGHFRWAVGPRCRDIYALIGSYRNGSASAMVCVSSNQNMGLSSVQKMHGGCLANRSCFIFEAIRCFLD